MKTTRPRAPNRPSTPEIFHHEIVVVWEGNRYKHLTSKSGRSVTLGGLIDLLPPDITLDDVTVRGDECEDLDGYAQIGFTRVVVHDHAETMLARYRKDIEAYEAKLPAYREALLAWREAEALHTVEAKRAELEQLRQRADKLAADLDRAKG